MQEQLAAKGFKPSNLKGVIVERSAEFEETYKYRKQLKTRMHYTLKAITGIEADGTVTGFVQSTDRQSGPFTKHIDEL